MNVSNQIKVFRFFGGFFGFLFCLVASRIFALGMLWAVIRKSFLMRYVLEIRSKEF